MMKKRKGSIVDILPSMIMVIAAVMLIMVFFDLYQILSLNEDVKQIARKYMLTMETMGYLDPANQTTLVQELSDLQVTDIDLTGSTMSDAEYGNAVYLQISCKIVSMGMAHVPEGRRVFAQLSVLQNLMMGAYTRKDKEEITQTLETVFDRFPRLKERQNQMAGTLSGGEQQMLAMGRALMSHPKIILMDEPSMGLSPIFVNEIFDIIQEVSKSGTTVLLVEQNAKKALSIADRAYVLETGKIVLEGKASDLLNNDSIKKAYLGE